MATLFFSYSHVDEALRDRLERHMAMLKRQGLVDTWHDRRIVAGDEFAGRISEELERADVILLLISADFLASTYCYDVETKRAIERHEAGEARVIPVIVRPCDWRSAPFGGIQAAPKNALPVVKWANEDDAFLDVVSQIRSALAAGGTRPISSTSSVPAETEPTRPRSSNLRVAKSFSQADKDKFQVDAFEYISRFFENSLEELKARNAEVDFSFRRIDANRFTTVVYRGGNAVSQCSVTLSGGMLRGINYSINDNPSNNSINENLSVESDGEGLFLQAMGMGYSGQGTHHLSFEGAAEYYWSMLIKPLQRQR